MLSPSYALNLSDFSRETKGTQVRRTTSWSPFSKAERRKCRKERAEEKLRELRKFPVTEDRASGKRGGRGMGRRTQHLSLGVEWARKLQIRIIESASIRGSCEPGSRYCTWPHWYRHLDGWARHSPYPSSPHPLGPSGQTPYRSGVLQSHPAGKR